MYYDSDTHFHLILAIEGEKLGNSLPQIQPLVRTLGYRRFILCSTLGHVGGMNSCGGYTLMGVATTHAA